MADGIKQQGRPIPGIDYGINLVSRKKNYDEDGNSLDDYSEDNLDIEDRISPTQSIKSYRTSNTQKMESSRDVSPSQHVDSEKDRHSARLSNDERSIASSELRHRTGNANEPEQPTWLNDRNFMGEYDDDKSIILDDDTVIDQPKMSFAEIQRAKEDFIAKLARLETKGYRSVKIYSLTSELKDIEDAYNKTYSQYSCDKAIKFQGKVLIGIIGFIEGLNKKYDPFNIYLTGWSEALYENLDEYEEVFEELYEKYKEQFDMISPEFRLFGMVVMSGVMFHFSHAVIAKAKKMMPGFDTVMNENPDLKKQYVAAAAKQGMPGSAPSGFDNVSKNNGNGIGNGNGNDKSPGGFLSNFMSGIPMLNTIMKNMNKSGGSGGSGGSKKDISQSTQLTQPTQPTQSNQSTQRIKPEAPAPKTRQNNVKTEFSKQNYADDLLRGMTTTKRRDISEMDSIGDLSEDD
jgi:hypothetical protein